MHKTVIIEDEVNPGPISVKEDLINLSGFDVFPNPASDQVFIAMNLREQASINIKLVDLQGNEVQKLYSGEMLTGLNEISFTLNESTDNGVYILMIEGESFITSKKLIVLR